MSAAAERIMTARERLIIGVPGVPSAPFYGVLSTRLALVEQPGLGTMATDAVNLFYDPAAMADWSDDVLLGVIAHEVEHCARDHMSRLQGRDLEIANRAADYAINADLLAAGFKLPNGVWHDNRFRGMPFEEIYSILASETAPTPQNGPGKPQDGRGDAGASQAVGNAGAPQDGTPAPGNGNPSGKSQDGAGKPQDGGNGAPGTPGAGTPQDGAGTPGAGNGQPSSLPGAGTPGEGAKTYGVGGIMLPGDGAPATVAEIAHGWQVATVQAANIVKSGIGNMPGNLQTILDTLREPVMDCREIFAAFIDSKVATSSSWSRPNRRFAHSGLFLPSATVDALAHLVFIVDTSGSINGPMLRNAASEVAGAFDAGKVERLTVISCDAKVRHVQEFGHGDTVDAASLILRGGGGTRFSPALNWIRDNAPDASAVIYLTDMECNDWGEPLDCPVLWAIHGDSRRFADLARRAPFGDAVYVGRL